MPFKTVLVEKKKKNSNSEEPTNYTDNCVYNKKNQSDIWIKI